MLQDIYPHTYHNEYRPHAPRDTDYVLSYDATNLHLKDTQTPFQVLDLPSNIALTYLFDIDETTYYLGDLSLFDHFSVPIHSLRSYQPRVLAFASLTGWQLYNWLKENKYCGHCGTPYQLDEKERALRCPHCNQVLYPRLSPAVIVGIINDRDEILVTKYAHAAYKKYALVAGFAEIGETIEDTVRREVKEETGLEIEQIRYYKSQPWSLTGTLLFGFWCKAKNPDDLKIDDNELSVGRWITREELEPLLPDPVALTGEMMLKFVKGEHKQ